MIMNATTTVTIELDEYEFEIFSGLIKKIKEKPSKIGLTKGEFDTEEAIMIDGFYQYCGHKSTEGAVNIIAENTAKE